MLLNENRRAPNIDRGMEPESSPGGRSSIAKSLRRKWAFQKLKEGQCGWDTEIKGSKSGVGG